MQRRALVTVAALQAATKQVLLRKGEERLTTTHVAKAAGVSVGTLYQYYPDKHCLLFAVLEEHLTGVVQVLEQACSDNHEESLRRMIDDVVKRFVEVKLADRRLSLTLYRIAGKLGGDLIVDRFRIRCEEAISAMLRSSQARKHVDTKIASQMIFLTMAGVLRGYFLRGAPPREDRRLTEALTQIVYSYCCGL